MKPLTATLALVATLFSTAAFGAVVLEITTATIANAKLTVKGIAPAANQNVKLDGQFTVKSNAQKNFTFVLTNYHPSDCVVKVTAGAKQAEGVVSNCGQSGIAVDVTATVNILGLNAHSCGTFNVTVPGVAVGDVVVLSVVGDEEILSSSIITAERVTAADTVKVKNCNPSDSGGVSRNGIQLRFIAFH